MPRIYAEAYLELMKEHEPLTLAKLQKSNRLESKLAEVQREYKARERDVRMSIWKKDPLPNNLLERVARVGNDESVAREVAMGELAELFSKEGRRQRPRVT